MKRREAMRHMIREKPHRLPASCYVGRVMASFTICTKDRKPLLANDEIFEKFKTVLEEEVRNGGCEAPVYLFMPDHCHILLEGKHAHSNVLDVVKRFKQKTGFWFSKNFGGTCWHRNFYDHIVRDDVDERKQVMYILNNPAKKGLIEDWKQYKFKGSTVYNFEEW
jgi:putative transposase